MIVSRQHATKAVGVVLVAGMVLAISLTAASCGSSTSNEPFEVLERIAVKPEVFRVTVTETGELRPRDVVVVPGPIHGEILELAPEGTYAKKGDKLAVVDDQEVREDVERDELRLKSAQAHLEGAKLDRELTGKLLLNECELAKVAVAREEAELKALLAKPTDEEKSKAQVDVDQARVNRDAAHDKYERSQTLWDKGVVSKGELIRDKLQYQQAQAALDKALVEQELVLKGAPEEDINIAREKVAQTEVKLDQAMKNMEAQLALKDTSVDVALAGVEQKENSLARGKKIMDSAVVYAPCEGTVLYNLQWGRPEEGKRVWKGDPFLDIVNLSKMVVETRVNEVDYARIGVGQKVAVTLEAFPEKKYHGKVSHTAGIAKDRSHRRQGVLRRDTSGVMIFELIVEIEEGDPQLRPTMTATLDITVEELPGAIAIPYRAIQEELTPAKDGASEPSLRKYVWVEENGRYTQRDIKTGLAGTSRIVIEKGLKAGDVVLVPKRIGDS